MSLPQESDFPFIFSLLALNDRAEDVVNHPSNKRLAWTNKDGTTLLGIEFNPILTPLKRRSTIAILGRTGSSDIVIEGDEFSKIHCSFEVHRDTNIIMLHDRSQAESTDFFGEDSIPIDENDDHKIRKGGERKVAVHPTLNTSMMIGNVEETLLMFKLIWHCNIEQMTKQLQDRDRMEIDEDPQEAWTQVIPDIERLPDTVLPSRSLTRVHTPGPQVEESIRYSILGGSIGSGRFGKVYKAVNVDTGDLFAVKVIKLPEQASLGERY